MLPVHAEPARLMSESPGHQVRHLFRRLRFGLATLLGQRRGWFIPYRYAHTLPEPGRSPVYAEIQDRLDAALPAMERRLAEAAVHRARFEQFSNATPPEPRWQQDWFPRLDGVMAYLMVLEMKPRRIVEIGSGHSTRFMMRAIRDGGLATKFVSIDPAPRADISALPIGIERVTLDEAMRRGGAAFGWLGAGDILFVDSSHILMPGSDVDVILSRLLPRLASGIILHFHDIFLPDDYPAEWGWRGYSEQAGIAPLIGAGACEILFASRYIVTRHADLLARHGITQWPLLPGAFESSLWLRKN